MRPILIACFVASGASGLIYEVVWTRQLGHVFGSDVVAAATVLAVFMAGLALGSRLAGSAGEARGSSPGMVRVD